VDPVRIIGREGFSQQIHLVSGDTIFLSPSVFNPPFENQYGILVHFLYERLIMDRRYEQGSVFGHYS
jgi:hypothetical protein